MKIEKKIWAEETACAKERSVECRRHRRQVLEAKLVARERGGGREKKRERERRWGQRNKLLP